MTSEAVQLRIFTIDEAKAWVGRVNDTLEELAGLITEGYHHQAWTALGHGSWAEMCEAEITVPQLSRDQRRELVGALRSEGLSTRAIGAAVGASKSQVDRDLDEVSHLGHLPTATVGTDGKTYPAERVELVEDDDELWLIDGDEAVIVEDDDLTPTATEPGDWWRELNPGTPVRYLLVTSHMPAPGTDIRNDLDTAELRGEMQVIHVEWDGRSHP